MYISFNQDSSCFAICNKNGFIVYNCEPTNERFKRISNLQDKKGLSIIEMLYRSNILALVSNDVTKLNILNIWDDYQNKNIAEISFDNNITGVKLKRNIIAIATLNTSYVYDFENMNMIYSQDTYININGLISVSKNDMDIVALSGVNKGEIYIKNLTLKEPEIIIKAHNSDISAFTLNNDGTRLATASDRGTLIRIWDTSDGSLVKELRRGLEMIKITNICFDIDTLRLMVCTEKNKVHLFSLLDTEKNKESSLKYFKDYLPKYFSSEWSVLTFYVPERTICVFGSNHDTIYAISKNTNHFYKYEYNPEIKEIEIEFKYKLY